MADIKVVIQLQDTVEDIIEKLGSSTSVNNASIQKTNDSFGYLSTKSDGTNMKSWAKQTYKNGEYVGSLSLADGFVGGANTQLIEQYGYNGYVFGAVPESKQLTVTLEVRGENIDSIIIYGDKNANQFPTKAYRDGDTADIIYSDDPIWAIKFDNVASSHTITFLEWNRANYNACITYVAELKNKLYLDKSWIKSVESLSQSTGQPKEIYYGVTPSSGRIEILDRDGEIGDYFQDGILEISNTNIDIYCNNNEDKLVSHISNDGEYLRENKSLLLSLEDNFDLVLNKTYFGRNLSESTNAYNVIYSLISDMGYINSIETILGEDIIVENNQVMTVKEYLSNITIPYPYLEESTYREALNKFCTLAQLNIIKKDGTDIPVFISSRPIVTSSTQVIDIPKSKIFSDFQSDVIVKNKIKSVSCEYRDTYYDFVEILNNKIQIFDVSDNPPSSYSDLDSKRVLGNMTNNSGFSILKEKIQDTNSYSNTSLNKYLYSIVKFTLREKININLDYMRFKLSASPHIVRPLSNSTYSTTQQWVEYTNENYPDIDIKDYTQSDNDIISVWLHPTYGTFSAASNLEMKVRINQDGSQDYFVAFLETIQSSSGSILSFIDNYSMSFNTKKVKYINLVTGENADVEIKANEMLQNETLYNGNKIVDIIRNNILNDYSAGVKTGRLTIACLDYYSDGDIIKDWNKGQVVSVGDCVRINRDDTTWRVTGRNFRKAGVPMIDLELQEVRVVG